MKTAILHRVVVGAIVFLTITFPFTVSPSLVAERMSASEPKLLPDDCLPKYPPPPVVKIKVRVPAYSAPSQQIEYRICVENCSTAEAHNVVVKDMLPSNVKFVKSDPEPSKKDPDLQWNLGTVGGGAVREIVLVVQPTNREDVKNCARVQFEHGQCVVTRLAARGDLGGKPPIIETVPDEPPPGGLPILGLTIEGPKQQYSNLATKYIVTVTNKGKSNATRTLVAVRLPNKLKFVRASENAQGVDNLVAWNLGTLDAGKSRVLELTVRAAEAGEYCIKASVEADHDVRANAEFCTKFASTSAMTLEMVGKEGVVFLGGKTSYSVAIKNQGSTPIANVKVRTFVPDALKFESSNPKFDKSDPALGGEWIEFKTLPAIEVGALVRYEVVVQATKAGVTRFHLEVQADELTSGPIVEQEITNIVDPGEKN